LAQDAKLLAQKWKLLAQKGKLLPQERELLAQGPMPLAASPPMPKYEASSSDSVSARQRADRGAPALGHTGFRVKIKHHQPREEKAVVPPAARKFRLRKSAD
jgi:hypothetical protein